MSDKKSISKMKKISIYIAIIVTITFLKNPLMKSIKIFDVIANYINVQMFNVRSIIYKQEISIKTKVKNINSLNDYMNEYEDLNTRLQKEIGKNIELENIKKDNNNLRTMLELKQKYPTEYITSEVVLAENFNESNRIFISKGSKEGILNNLPVMYNGILIGRVNSVHEDFSEVLLVTSRDFRMSVILNGGDSQILRGNGDGTFSILNYNGNKAETEKNYRIETSGVSDIFPKGVLLGQLQVQDLTLYKKKKELRFKAPFNVHNIKNILVYKFDNNRILREQISKEIEEAKKSEENIEK